jgi:hypothetical protein
MYGYNSAAIVSTVSGRFTIASAKNFELQQQFSIAYANGMGIAASFGTEVYSRVEFWKEN